MATELFTPTGLQLESVFAPISGATPVANVELYDTSGVDISQRFFPLTRARQAALTELYTPAGVDLADVFDTEAGVPQNFSGNADATNPTTSGGANAFIQFETDGDINPGVSPDGSGSATQWFSVLRSGVGNDYQVSFHVNAISGGTALGTYDTWLALSSARSAGLDVGFASFGTMTLAATVRRASDGVAVCSGTFSLSAEGAQPI